jgi:hypothetical protein
MDETSRFGDVAQRLARNPLGIIALFIVLVYGLAAQVTIFASSISARERLPLVYFLVGFPVLVLGVFAWLVGKHSNKLFSPQDFQNEEKLRQAAVGNRFIDRCVSQGGSTSRGDRGRTGADRARIGGAGSLGKAIPGRPDSVGRRSSREQRARKTCLRGPWA